MERSRTSHEEFAAVEIARDTAVKQLVEEKRATGDVRRALETRVNYLQNKLQQAARNAT